MNTQQLLNQVTAFIWQEADMLDHGDFAQWLDLWTEDATYIIPIDPLETDFENTLNYAYDNHHMRQLRVTRLTSGESISTTRGPARCAVSRGFACWRTRVAWSPCAVRRTCGSSARTCSSTTPPT